MSRSRRVPAVLAGLLVALAGCQAAPPVANAVAPALDTPRLASVDNFRDLAGTATAYATAHGHHLRPGVVYRSNALTLADADLAAVERLGVATVVDLRTRSEIDAAPDRVPAGAAYVDIDVFGQSGTAPDPSAMFAAATPEAAVELLRQANVAFVTDPGRRAQFAQVLRTVAAADGPVVVHCTAGKDRTGWVAAVLQLTAGVPEPDVMADYLATNTYSAASIAATTEKIRAARGDAAAAVYSPLLGVRDGFLRAGLDALRSEYGDIDGYLTRGLGLAPATVAALRTRLVAPE